jgi:N6-L-threonylcarbamoyladenine synthase
MLTLGIETSCDDTSIAVLRGESELLSNIVSSQLEHSAYGGIVPELASRAHVQNIVPVFRCALAEAGVEAEELDLIGVTTAPGLIGSLLVGGAFAQGLSLALERPIVPVHHIEAHIVANLLEYQDLELPAVALVVSGGHTLLVYVGEWRQYEVMGTTRDDAAGEAFDKVAKLLGLGFPGGPEIEQLAVEGDPQAIPFPRPMLAVEGFEFSFSGLKTAVVRWVEQAGPDEVQVRLADVCASLLAGGVACNNALRAALRDRIGERARVLWPQPINCTDNGAMIARTALLRVDEAVGAGEFDVAASRVLV